MKSKDIVDNISSFFTKEVSTTLEQCTLGYIKVTPSSKAKKEKLLQGLFWLSDFELVLMEYKAVRSLHHEDTWSNFSEIFGDDVNDLEEIVDLNKKKELVIAKWKQRPGVLRKTKEQNEV
jgi:hypothetical protein